MDRCGDVIHSIRAPWWLRGKKNLPASAEEAGLIPRSGRAPGEGNGNSLQYSCLGNPMNREDWQAAIHGAAKESDTT